MRRSQEEAIARAKEPRRQPPAGPVVGSGTTIRGRSRSSQRAAPRRQSRPRPGESPRLLDLVQIKRRHRAPRDRREQAKKTLGCTKTWKEPSPVLPDSKPRRPWPADAELLQQRRPRGSKRELNAAQGGYDGQRRGTKATIHEKGDALATLLGSKNSHRTPARSPGALERENEKNPTSKPKETNATRRDTAGGNRPRGGGGAALGNHGNHRRGRERGGRLPRREETASRVGSGRIARAAVAGQPGLNSGSASASAGGSF